MHRNAPLTPEGRLRLCRLIEEDGWTVAAAAESFRISRQTAHKWWGRYQLAGEAGLVDRPSRPRRCPTKTPAKVERRVVELRRRHQVSAARLAERAGVPASTLHQIWSRHGVSRLSDLERRTGRVIRRIETSRPGELVHVDIKKQAKIPPGGGWRMKAQGQVGRIRNGQGGRPRLGYAYVHSAVDAYSRLAYSEVHANEQGVTAVAFWRRARDFFASYGIIVERVMTDNGKCYTSKVFGAELVAAAIVHTRIKPYCPRTNGKVERYNRTLLNEWAYARPYRSEAARTRALDKWLHMYNYHRNHTAIGGPPVSRVNNVPGQNN
jgi:transposase InsO family protein